MQRSKIKFIIFVVAFLMTSLVLDAQNAISSPYSRYGIGNTNLFGNAINNSMGGVGYAMQRNNAVNYLNPASYAGVDTMSFVYDIGFYTEWLTLSSNTAKVKGNNTNLSHILLAFPIGKHFKIAAGVMPMSSVDFTAEETITEDTTNRYKFIYAGDGGVNKVVAGLAYAPISNLSIGLNMEYLFGNYYRSTTTTFLDTNYVLSSRKENNYHIRALNLNFGTQYFHPLKNGDKLGIGLVFNPSLKLSTDNVSNSFTFIENGDAGNRLIDSVNTVKNKGKITYPQSMGLGFSYERQNKFFIALDGKYTKWSEFLFQSDIQNNYLVDNYRFSLGGEWKPNAYGNYLQKIVYRGGFVYDNGMLEIRDKRISQYGISFGLGLPIRKSNTLVNISFEYGKRGTKQNDLIQEDYFRIGLSLSAKDIWFFKRKYQ